MGNYGLERCGICGAIIGLPSYELSEQEIQELPLNYCDSCNQEEVDRQRQEELENRERQKQEEIEMRPRRKNNGA